MARREQEHALAPAGRARASSCTATLLTEDAASGGGLVLPEYREGIMPIPQRPMTVAQLFARGTPTSGAIGYMREKTFTNAAAPVLEGGAKPESAMTFELVTAALKKIAHWIPATDEILDNVPTLRSYIDSRLRLGVELKLDDQLLNGDGVGAESARHPRHARPGPPVAQGTRRRSMPSRRKSARSRSRPG